MPEVRNNEEWYRLLFEQARDSILLLEIQPDGAPIIRDANGEALRARGYSRDELVGKPVSFLDAGDELAAVTAERLRLLRSPEGAVFEARHRRKDGSVIVVEASVKEIAVGGKRLAVAIARDITERLRAEEALRDSEMRYRRLFEAAQDGILIVDAETGTIRDANPFIIDLLGFSHGQMVNKKLWEIGAFKDCFANWEKFKVLQDRGYIRYEGLPLVAADGRKLFVEFVSNAYTVNDCRVLQCNIRDNTEHRNAELAKEKLAGALAEKNREMEGFLYITTHDLRTPLVNIQGFSQNLGKDLKKVLELLAPASLPEDIKSRLLELISERIPESLGYITGGVEKMNQLIAALLQVSRIGRLQINAKTVDMNSVLKTVLDTFAYQLEKIGGAIKVEALPPCRADAEVIGQFFSRFLDNAIKYRDRGRKLKITVRGEIKDAHTVLYTVSDNGRGIKAADLEKIWQVFYSGHEQDPDVEKGEGIGLTVAKRMVEKIGGRIWVESKEGAGAKFFIELPAQA